MCATPTTGARRCSRSESTPPRAGASVLGFASSGLPGPAGNLETFVWIAEPGREGALEDLEAAAEGRNREPPARTLTVYSHARPEQTGDALRRVIAMAREAGVEVNVPQEEVDKHGIEPADGIRLGADPSDDTDLAVVLGGDGTIL